MPTTLKSVTNKYLKARNLAQGTRSEYQTTLAKWQRWKGRVPIERLDRPTIREFLNWIYDRAVSDGGSNPGRTSNKARTHLRAVLTWAWDNDLLEQLPRFPKPVQFNNVAGRHYLTKSELNSLYFATHEMSRPRGWTNPIPVGRYWRAALVVFYNYGLDSGTVWGTIPAHEPILWRHVSWDRTAPNRQLKESSKWGWLLYRRVKTRKSFCRPMNRVVHIHLKSLQTENCCPSDPVFLGGSSRPNVRFRELCELARIDAKTDSETGEQKHWLLKDLRKTAATYYDEHMPESSIEILGHSVGGVTYRHYAHRAPLAHKAINTLPQPSAFSALLKGFDEECPCCRRPFADAS